MAKRKFHIESLRIRLPRSAAASAEVLAGKIGMDFLRGMAGAVGDIKGKRRIDILNIGSLQLSGDGESLERRVARRGATELRRKFDVKEGK